jgi:RNA polymerase sigma-70 factor, ECF subfamily
MDCDVSLHSDAELAAGIVRGSPDALAEAYSRHRHTVENLARRICGADHAADVVQEVFLRLWHRPGGFDPARGTLRNYLMMQTRGHAIDALRSDNSRRVRETASHLDRTTVTEDERFLARLMSDDIRHGLSRLSAVEREAIALAFFGGYTYREVADLLGEPEGTVKSRVRTGLLRLRTRLRSSFSEPPPPSRRIP